MSSTLKHDDLVDRLASTIQARILSGEIPSEARLRQASLAAEFGVSRTPVREAYLVRGELEGLAAELATPLLTDEDVAKLHSAQALFRRSIESELERRRTGAQPAPWSAESDWERANNLFHQVIQEASGNRVLLASIAYLHRSFPRHLTWAALSRSSHLLGVNVDEHTRILDALERRDSVSAREEMTAHVHSAGELVASRLERVR